MFFYENFGNEYFLYLIYLYPYLVYFDQNLESDSVKYQI